jgi:large subunit ribosomal protein L9
MELILKKDVENLGFTDDLVSVKNGYGRNYLIPNGHAVLATPSAKKVLAETLKQRSYKEKKTIEDAQKEADKLNGLELKITAKTGEGDKLFGSINNANLADALEKEEVVLEKKFITIAGGRIKRLGQYNANIRFHRDVIVNFSFEVVSEKKK